MAYLDEGIVPPPDFMVLADGDHLRESLESLTSEEARKARRRFRKIFRRAMKWRIEHIQARVKDFPYSSRRRSAITQSKILDFKADVGLAVQYSPVAVNVRHQQARRRLVLAYMLHRSSREK
jgi:hypothetical protein